MLKQRVFTALAGIPLFLVAVFYSKTLLGIIVAVLSLVGINELRHLGRRIGYHPSLFITGILGLSYVVAAYFNKGTLLFVAGMAVFAGGMVFFLPLRKGRALTGLFGGATGAGLGFSLLGSLYVAWSLAHFLLLANQPAGAHYILLILLATWATDTFAYFAGKSLGRRKLAPAISPNKTWEGSLGGTIGAVIVSAVLGLLWPKTALAHYALLGFILSVTGQLGDLAESAMKRRAGVKDSGKIFPGHGGVLDRFDSLLVNLLVAYYYIQWFIIK